MLKLLSLHGRLLHNAPPHMVSPQLKGDLSTCLSSHRLPSAERPSASACATATKQVGPSWCRGHICTCCRAFTSLPCTEQQLGKLWLCWLIDKHCGFSPRQEACHEPWTLVFARIDVWRSARWLAAVMCCPRRLSLQRATCPSRQSCLMRMASWTWTTSSAPSAAATRAMRWAAPRGLGTWACGAESLFHGERHSAAFQMRRLLVCHARHCFLAGSCPAVAR